MKRIVIIILLILTIITFTNEYNKAYKYVYNIATYYGVNKSRANLLANTIATEYEKYSCVPYQVFTALIVSETAFKNVYGDNNKAVGYCQLHETSVWYVLNFFPDLEQQYKKINNFQSLIKYPALQVKIGYRYLYLIMKYITNYNIIEALNYWNNNSEYYKRVFNILNFLEKIY